jgi:hypothetical protein
MSEKDLKDRVDDFQMLRLPGQPMGMHMGTSYLVNDLWREVAALRAELASIPKATIGDVSYYGTLAEPALLVELADTRAELERLRGALIWAHREICAAHFDESYEPDTQRLKDFEALLGWDGQRYTATQPAAESAESGEESGAKED